MMCGDGCCAGGCGCGDCGACMGGSGRGMMGMGRMPGAMKPLLLLLVLGLVIWVGLKARNEAKQYQYIGVPITQPHTINVSGEGKVNAVPDVATVDLGMSTERSTVGAAQQENTRVMNAIIAKLGEMGVDKKDIQTSNYNLYQVYDYSNNKQTLRGYSVSQNVRVKVRRLDAVGDIISAAGDLGANQVGGVSFTIDQPESLRQEAREQALRQAKEKAEALAKIMGVELVRVVSFDENGYVPSQPMPMLYAKDMAIAEARSGSAPSIEAGSTDVVINANVTYEIR